MRTTRILSAARLGILGFLISMAAACGRNADHLQPIQRMAYGAKPAVVRVSAYSTGRFHYPVPALRQIVADLREQGLDAMPESEGSASGIIETGAGGSGSGFIVHPDGWILTSGHVVAPTREEKRLERELKRNGAIAVLMERFPRETLRALSRGGELDRYVERLAGSGSIDDVQIHDSIELSNGDVAPYRIEKYSPSLQEGGQDLALLSIERHDLPTLGFGESERVLIQDEIWVIGYPAVASSGDEIIGGWLSRETDLEPTFNPGTITAIKRNVEGLTVFQTDAPVYRGNSGGPAVDREGHVVGIPTWGHTEADQIKFLVPSGIAREFIGDRVELNVEGDFNRHYRSALAEASRGNWRAARKGLIVADTLFPNSPDLIRFIRDADTALEQSPVSRSLPLLISLGAVLLLAGGAASLRLVSRRSEHRTELFPQVLVTPTSRGSEPQTSDSVPPSREIPELLGRFTILNGERAGERMGLGGSGIRIGREPALCEIVLMNPKISRLHAELVWMEGRTMLVDRNSSNGTWVNDRKIDRAFLDDGDIIYFGGRNAVAVAYHACEV